VYAILDPVSVMQRETCLPIRSPPCRGATPFGATLGATPSAPPAEAIFSMRAAAFRLLSSWALQGLANFSPSYAITGSGRPTNVFLLFLVTHIPSLSIMSPSRVFYCPSQLREIAFPITSCTVMPVSDEPNKI